MIGLQDCSCWVTYTSTQPAAPPVAPHTVLYFRPPSSETYHANSTTFVHRDLVYSPRLLKCQYYQHFNSSVHTLMQTKSLLALIVLVFSLISLLFVFVMVDSYLSHGKETYSLHNFPSYIYSSIFYDIQTLLKQCFTVFQEQ